MIGEPGLVAGYALAGAVVLAAEGPAQARKAWRDLPASVSLVILTESAAQALTDDLRDSPQLTVVMPI